MEERAKNKTNQMSLQSKKKEKGLNNDMKNKVISNAYKNIINVISNLLDNIEDQKKNGKCNLQYSPESNNIHKKISFNKNPVKKLISYNPAITKFSLNNNVNIKKNTLKKPISAIKSMDKISKRKKIQIYGINSPIIKEEPQRKENGYLSSLKKSSKKTIKTIFFKPKNKLKKKAKLSSKTIISNPLVNNQLNKECLNNTFSSLFGSGIGISINPITKKRNSLQVKRRSFIISKNKSNITNISKDKKDESKNNELAPFKAIRTTIEIDPEIIRQKLYEYENNEITHAINQLPGDMLKKKKRIKIKEILKLLLKKK